MNVGAMAAAKGQPPTNRRSMHSCNAKASGETSKNGSSEAGTAPESGAPRRKTRSPKAHTATAPATAKKIGAALRYEWPEPARACAREYGSG